MAAVRPVPHTPTEVREMAKGNNAQGKEAKKPKKGAKATPVKAAAPAPKK